MPAEILDDVKKHVGDEKKIRKCRRRTRTACRKNA